MNIVEALTDTLGYFPEFSIPAFDYVSIGEQFVAWDHRWQFMSANDQGVIALTVPGDTSESAVAYGTVSVRRVAIPESDVVLFADAVAKVDDVSGDAIPQRSLHHGALQVPGWSGAHQVDCQAYVSDMWVTSTVQYRWQYLEWAQQCVLVVVSVLCPYGRMPLDVDEQSLLDLVAVA